MVDEPLRERLPLADNCVILERGATAWSGPPGDLDGAVSDCFLEV